MFNLKEKIKRLQLLLSFRVLLVSFCRTLPLDQYQLYLSVFFFSWCLLMICCIFCTVCSDLQRFILKRNKNNPKNSINKRTDRRRHIQRFICLLSTTERAKWINLTQKIKTIQYGCLSLYKQFYRLCFQMWNHIFMFLPTKKSQRECKSSTKEIPIP